MGKKGKNVRHELWKISKKKRQIQSKKAEKNSRKARGRWNVQELFKGRLYDVVGKALIGKVLSIIFLPDLTMQFAIWFHGKTANNEKGSLIIIFLSFLQNPKN